MQRITQLHKAYPTHAKRVWFARAQGAAPSACELLIALFFHGKRVATIIGGPAIVACTGVYLTRAEPRIAGGMFAI